MLFNTDKCKVMHVGKKNKHYVYTMNNRQLESVEAEKDLGVIITEDGKPSVQCVEACAKANRVLGMIKRTIVSRKQNILISLYKSLVRPIWSIVQWPGHHTTRKTK